MESSGGFGHVQRRDDENVRRRMQRMELPGLEEDMRLEFWMFTA